MTAAVVAAQDGLIGLVLDTALGRCATAPPSASACSTSETLAANDRTVVRPEERIAYRIEEVAALTGVSRATVRKHVGTRIRSRRVGGALLLDPKDVHRTFGFDRDETVAPSAEAMAEMEDLLQ